MDDRNIEVAADEHGLLDLLLVIAKHNRFIIKLTLFAALLAVVASLSMSNIYTAKTVIMPPQRSQSTAAMVLGQLGPVGGGAFGVKTAEDLFIGMLKSRSVADALVKRFSVQAKDPDAARQMLAGATSISAGKDGFITIEFSDRDPKRAAEIANAYVDELNRISANLAITEASQRRLFFERQLNLVRDKLAKAESELQQLQQKSGVIRIYPQEKELAEANAKLRAEIASRQVQLSAMQIGVTSRNPEYQRLQGELASLKSQLDGGVANDSIDSKTPQGGTEYLAKFREVKYQQAEMDLLYKQYDIARIDEAKDYPLVQVLDAATPPEKKSKPVRSLIVIMTTLAAFFLSIILAFFREAAARAASNPEQAERVAALRMYLRKG